MNVSNQVSAATTQVSGAVTIVSASSSKTASTIAGAVPDAPTEVIVRASEVATQAETIGICSFVVMLLSFAWNVYSTSKRDKLDREFRERELALREREYDGSNDRRKQSKRHQ